MHACSSNRKQSIICYSNHEEAGCARNTVRKKPNRHNHIVTTSPRDLEMPFDQEQVNSPFLGGICITKLNTPICARHQPIYLTGTYHGGYSHPSENALILTVSPYLSTPPARSAGKSSHFRLPGGRASPDHDNMSLSLVKY